MIVKPAPPQAFFTRYRAQVEGSVSSTHPYFLDGKGSCPIATTACV